MPRVIDKAAHLLSAFGSMPRTPEIPGLGVSNYGFDALHAPNVAPATLVARQNTENEIARQHAVAAANPLISPISPIAPRPTIQPTIPTLNMPNPSGVNNYGLTALQPAAFQPPTAPVARQSPAIAPQGVPSPVMGPYGVETPESRRARYTAEAAQRLPAAQAQLSAAQGMGQPRSQDRQNLQDAIGADIEKRHTRALQAIANRRMLRKPSQGVQTQAGIDSMKAMIDASNAAQHELYQVKQQNQAKEQERAFHTQEREAAQKFQAEQKQLDRQSKNQPKSPKIASPAEAAAMIPLRKKPEGEASVGRPKYGWSDDQTPEERMQQIRDGQKAHAQLMKESGANPYTARPDIASQAEATAEDDNGNVIHLINGQWIDEQGNPI